MLLSTQLMRCYSLIITRQNVPITSILTYFTPDMFRFLLWELTKYLNTAGSGGTLEAVSVPSRALAIFWSLFMVVVFATYTANLAAYLTVTIINLPITTLEDLAHSAYILPLVKNGSSEIIVLEVISFPKL